MRDERGEGRGPRKAHDNAESPTPESLAETTDKSSAEKDAAPESPASSSLKAAEPVPTVAHKTPAPALDTAEFEDFEQIEYLIHQSTLGNHFLFDNSDVARILRTPFDKEEFSSDKNRNKVQSLLSSLLDRPTLKEKRAFLSALPTDDFERLVRAYFQLVENTILAHAEGRH